MIGKMCCYGCGMEPGDDNGEDEMIDRLKIISGVSTDRLRELSIADHDGRLVILPDCKINDLVAVHNERWGTIDVRVDCFYIDENGVFVGHFDNFGELMRWKDFGKANDE